MNDTLLNDFRHFLNSNEVAYRETEFSENLDFIKRQIRYEYFLARFTQEEAQKVLLEGDPQVAKALEVLPQAKALYQNAKKVMASKRGPGR